MARSSPSLDSLVRAATGPRMLAPLLRALGFDAPLQDVGDAGVGAGAEVDDHGAAAGSRGRTAPTAIAGTARGTARGTDSASACGIDGVRRVLRAGERAGLAALVVELDDASPGVVAAVARRLRARNAARTYLFVFADPRYQRLTIASFGLGDELRRLVIDRAAPRRSDLEALEELAARDGEGGVALALRHARALDRGRVTRQFFRDFRAQRARIAAAWLGIPAGEAADRGRLALLFLSRLLFLYFLQRQGHLAGDPAYLPGLLDRWRRRPGAGTFYRAVLGPLFFGALNTRPERRDAQARALGALPYLNGGLFERHALERRHPALDLPDDAVAGAFDGLLERYRFTTREAAEATADGAGDVGVDPEMLGRVFEGLMAAERRSASGTFYTPAPAVDRLVRAALEAHLAGAAGLDPRAAARLVREGDVASIEPVCRRELARTLGALRVLDPACGSGAFLLGALTRLTRARTALGESGRAAVRRDIVGRCLHGVDLEEDAALLCALRLWLALAEDDGASTGGGDAGRAGSIAGGAAAGSGHATAGAVRTTATGVRAGRDAARGDADGVCAGPGSAAARGRPARSLPRRIEPLPNLDRRIRQGDALVDPIDLIGGAVGGAASDPAVRAAAVAGAGAAAGAMRSASDARSAGDAQLAGDMVLAAARTDAAVRRALRAVPPLAARYLSAGPEDKPALQRELAAAEASLARAWLDAIRRRLEARARELTARAAARDLFGAVPRDARRAESELREAAAHAAELARVRAALDEAGALPFFSFGVHFADAAERGFDLVLSNPPWVRAHRWPGTAGRLVRARYAVCRDAGWRRGAELAGAPRAAAAQVDLSLLFLERSLRLLAPGGTLGMLLPAKALRSLYGGGARRLLLRDAEPVSIEDHSLDQRSIFRADAFAVAIVARKAPRNAVATAAATEAAPTEPSCWRRVAAPTVRVTMIRRGAEPLRFCLARDDLPVLPDDDGSPWLLAPPAARAALRRMQAAGPPLGDAPGLRVRRGVVTGANDALIFRHVAPKLGGLAAVRALGYDRARRAGRPAADARRFRALVEEDALRPLVRGRDVAAWRYRTSDHVCWIHDDRTAEPGPAPPRLARYLARHRDALRARSGARDGRPPGALFRVSTATLAPKVAWHDLALTLNAVALPARVRGSAGRDVPLVPLNTVYFVPLRSHDDALLLAAFLNSLPVRTFARGVAERAKDARFRFLAWTVALVPLPRDWAAGPAADRLRRISARAHRDGAIDRGAEHELNRLIAERYGLSPDDMDALAAFDLWLRGDDR